jgi:hypothetical protein
MNDRFLGMFGAILIAAPLAASAQTETFEYTGSPLTSLTISGNFDNGLERHVPYLTGQIVFSSPLDATGLLSSINPEAGTPGNFATFVVSTNVQGFPVAKAPEINPTLAVSGLVMLLGGVGVLRGSRA